MDNLWTQFKKNILAQPDISKTDDGKKDTLIALGVLLWVVAEADDKFLPAEQDKIKNILTQHEKITDEDIPVVLQSIQKASEERIDLYTFSQEVSESLDRPAKISIIEDLFHVACADGDLDEAEHSMIRKIADLFRLDHEEFIDAKIRVKKEWGMDTAELA